MYSRLGFLCFVSWIFFSAMTATFLKLLSPLNHLFPPSRLIAVVPQRTFCTSVLISPALPRCEVCRPSLSTLAPRASLRPLSLPAHQPVFPLSGTNQPVPSVPSSRTCPICPLLTGHGSHSNCPSRCWQVSASARFNHGNCGTHHKMTDFLQLLSRADHLLRIKMSFKSPYFQNMLTHPEDTDLF